MSVAATITLPVTEFERMMRGEPVRDTSYREQTQLGAAVVDYLSWKRNEDGATPITLDGYERVLARLAWLHASKPAATVTVDDLRAARDLYPEKSRHKATAVYRDFFRWLYEESRIDTNPAGRLRYPKRHPAAITDLFTEEEKAAIVTAQTLIRDRVGVLLLLRAGLRKAELRNLQVRDVNLAERYVLVRRAKGGKSRRVPVRGAVVRALDEFVLTPIPGLDRAPEGDDHVLYGLRSANAHYRGSLPDPKRPVGQGTAHRWWYGCLERAGVVEPGTTRGRRMHATRHTYATDLGRATNWNMLAVQKNLGHSKIATTIDIYTQFAFEDQERAVEALPEIVPLEDF